MKKSIHLNHESVAYMAARAEEINYSAAINSAFQQLAHLARAEMPEIGDADFSEICNIYSGSDLSRIALPLNIAAYMLTHYGATVPSQLPAETELLVERLAHMTQVQQFALIDKVRIFRASNKF